MNNRETYEHLYVGGGRVTLAVITKEDGFVAVGMAFCSPKDQFIKAKGRMIAKGRAHAGSSLSYSFKKINDSYIENKAAAVTEFINRVTNFIGVADVPTWTIAAAKRGEICTVKESRAAR